MPCNGCGVGGFGGGCGGGFGSGRGCGGCGPGFRFPAGRFPGGGGFGGGGQSFVRFGPGGSVVVSNNNNNNNNSGGGSPWDAPFGMEPFCGPCEPFFGWNCQGPWGPWGSGGPWNPWFCDQNGCVPAQWCLCPATGATEPEGNGETGPTGATGAAAVIVAAECGDNSVAASSLLPQRRCRRPYKYHAELNPPIPDYLPQAQYVDTNKRDNPWTVEELASAPLSSAPGKRTRVEQLSTLSEERAVPDAGECRCDKEE